jgi:hypothetical protein
VEAPVETVQAAVGKPAAQAVKVGRDLVYLTVGTGVLAFQRLQVERRELEGKVRSIFG